MMGTETLQTQYETVRSETNKSHVLQWGQKTIAQEVVGEFEAGNYTTETSFFDKMYNMGKNIIKGWT